MTSTLHITPIGHRGEVTFKMPVKSVFGRVLCDTDGSTGYPTEFGPATALRIVEECNALTGLEPGDARDLDKVRRWAAAGYTMLADWVH